MKNSGVRIIDIRKKPVTEREATACAKILLKKDTIKTIKEGKIKKGNVLNVARCAGILAAKKVDELIPLCHSISLEYTEIDYEIGEDYIVINAKCMATSKTGVEMEAMMACSIASLTIYDMCKSIDKAAVIEQVKLIEKKGGKSGHYRRT